MWRPVTGTSAPLGRTRRAAASLVRILSASLVLALLATDANAAVRTWTGAVSGLWSNPGNWGGTAPVAGDDLVFPGGAPNATNTNDFPAGTLFNSIQFPNFGGYTVNGNAIVLGPGGLTASGGLTFGLAITLAADQTWTTIPGNAWANITGAIHLGGRALSIYLPYSMILSGPIDGSGAIVKDGFGALTLGGANTFAGLVTVRDGFLFLPSPTGLGLADGSAANGTHILKAGPGHVGATLLLQGVAVGNEALVLEGSGETDAGALRGCCSLAGPVTLVNGGTIGVYQPITLSGAVGGPGPLAFGGVASLTLSNASNSFGGGVVMHGPFLQPNATLVIGADQALPGAPTIDLAAGNTFHLNGHAQTLSAIAGTGTLNTSAAPGVLTLDGAGDTTFAGAITGTGTIVHSGSGRQAFTGTSTFSGPLAIDHGVVTVSGGTLPAPIAVSSDGRLSLAANGTVGALTISSGRLQLIEGGAATGNTGALTVGAAATLDIGGAAAVLGQLRVTGTVTLGGAALSLPASGLTPIAGTSFTIIANDGADAVVGTFAGLPEGATVVGSGIVFHISYIGGTGNDVVLTATVPALRTWTGAVSALWSDAGNWGGTAPVAGDDLFFPAGASNTTNTNDLPAGTLFHSITWASRLTSPPFTLSPYTVSGNPILVGPGGLTIPGDLTLALPITLAADQTWRTTVGGTWSNLIAAIQLGGRTLTLDLTYSVNVSGVIGGSGALVKMGPGMLTLSGANSYSGPTTLASGLLRVEHPTALGVADGTAANGTHVRDARLVPASGASLDLVGVAIGNEALMLEGLGETAAGAVRVEGPSSVAGPVTLGSGTVIGVYADLTLSGVVSGPGPLTPIGTATLTLTNSGNTFSGVNFTFQNGARLAVGANNAIPGAPVLDFGSGNTLVLGGHAQTLAGLAGNGVVDTSAAPGVLTLNGAGDTTFAGAVRGTGTMVHSGTGRQAFTGTSTFSGPLVIAHGVVAVSGGTVPAPVTVNDDGRLSLAASGTVGAVSVTSGRLQLTDGGAARGNTGNVSLAAAATLGIGGGAQASLGQLRVTGTVTLGGATLALQLPVLFPAPEGTLFTIVDNDGTDAVIGTFAGLAEGDSVTAHGASFHISYVGGTGNDVVLTAVGGLEYLLSEGATGSFFTTDLLLANPNDDQAPVRITFLRNDGVTIPLDLTLPAKSRRSVRVNDVLGMEATEFSTAVRSSAALPLAVERTMSWDRQAYGAHTERATAGAALRWYFAEGSQGFFHTYLLLANPQATANSATVRYLREFEPPVTRTYALAPTSRVTVAASEDTELVGRSFGMIVTFDQPGGAERAMYFGDAPLFGGGHESAGVTEPSSTWFLAEGATGSFFETFLLLANPGSTDASATITYLPAIGDAVSVVRNIPAQGRVTVNVEAEDPSLADAAVAITIAATQPILAERSQYWPDPAPAWREAHNSFGTVATATRWALAEGRVGGPAHAQTFILVANPGSAAANVVVTFLRDNGAAPIAKTFVVPPVSRFNIPVGPGTSVAELVDETFGALITSDQPIAVERALYWDATGQLWTAGTNAAGTPLP